MNDPKYAYPYPAQGNYQGPPMMAPPCAPPPKKESGFLKGFLKGCRAALCCCNLFNQCCSPSDFCCC